MQLTAPGAFPVNPFFFLIGLTYVLSVVYLATLRYVDAQPVAGGPAARGWTPSWCRRSSCVTGGITSDFSSLYLLPIIAASTLRHRRGRAAGGGA